MKFKILLIMLVALTSGSTMAGVVNDFNVTIDLTERTAMGNMKTARFSADAEEFIDCGTRTARNPDGTIFYWSFCQAGLSTSEENAFCFTQDIELINQIRSMSTYSFVTFRWDESGECTYVGQSTQSFYIP